MRQDLEVHARVQACQSARTTRRCSTERPTRTRATKYSAGSTPLGGLLHHTPPLALLIEPTLRFSVPLAPQLRRVTSVDASVAQVHARVDGGSGGRARQPRSCRRKLLQLRRRREQAGAIESGTAGTERMHRMRSTSNAVALVRATTIDVSNITATAAVTNVKKIRASRVVGFSAVAWPVAVTTTVTLHKV